MAAYLWWLLFPILSIARCKQRICFLLYSWKLLSSQLRCLIGATDTGDTEKYCLTKIAQNLDFAPWGHRNQCYIMGLLCGYLLHITKGRTIKIPPVVNMMIWQFFLLLFFAIIYAPYHTELETGYETPMQRYSSCLFCVIKLLRTFFLSRFWYSCSNLMWGICLFWLIFACCRGYGGDLRGNVSDIMQHVFGMFFTQARSMISSHGADGAQLQR